MNTRAPAALKQVMKILIFCVAITTAVFSQPAYAGDASDAPSLAFGYAQAFQCSGKTSMSIVYLNGNDAEIIKDVTEIKSFGGVLLIKGYAGARQILDPARIVKITDN
ncbi:MAG TPA: hypothetical protein VIM48_03710 [Chthoniobacterales bacterium]